MTLKFPRLRQRSLFLGCIVILIIFSVLRQNVKFLETVRQSSTIEERMLSQVPQQNEVTLPTKRVIYSRLRTDQSGWVIFDMLKAHAYAFSKNLTYGGACGDSVHKEDVLRVLTAVGWEDILPLQCPPATNSSSDYFLNRVYPSSYFQPKSGRRMGDPAWKNFIKSHTDFSYFEDDDNEKADAVVTSDGHNNGKQEFTVVVHIRRRDVTPCCYPQWYLPNSYFSSMIEKYRDQQKDKNVHVHIFSQSKTHESWDEFTNNTNYNLHLDGPIGDVWRAILGADVFIGSISEFSRVPSLFARGEIPDPRKISDPKIAAKTSADNMRLVEECREFELLGCRNHRWIGVSKKK